MSVVHKHLIIRAEVSQPIVDPKIAIDWMKSLIEGIGMKITEHGGPHCDYVEKPDNYGIAAVALIETSNLALHIWDRDQPPLVQLDVYSCSEFNVSDVISFLDVMKPTKIEYKFLDRENSLQITDSNQNDLQTEQNTFPPWYFYE